MTAEITVFNKEAVALATDSAVTLTLPSGQKIFTTATKLFALSDSHPVGIMVFNNPTFLGVPWETIVKMYKNQLRSKGHNTLKEYTRSFMSLLKQNVHVFNEDRQREFLKGFLADYFATLVEEIMDTIDSIIDRDGSIDKDTVKEKVSRIISRRLRYWRSVPSNKGALPTLRKSKSIIEKYRQDFNDAVDFIFQKLPLSTRDRELLFQLSIGVIAKGTNPSNNSGVVIAGYGESEVFPTIEVYTLEGMIDNTLVYMFEDTVTIDKDSDGGIYAFAQRDMAARFMEGVDPTYKEVERGHVEKLCSKYSAAIVKQLDRYTSDEKRELKRALSQYGKSLFEEYQKSMSEFIREQFVDPITQIVSFLPKSELATLAESLVSLTSLKRKFSIETETVAEPIDVAVISKMDGFVWIKRKSYTKL